MGMEPINKIASIQAQSMTRPAAPVKVSSEPMEGNAAENVAVPKIDNTTVRVARSQEGNGKNNQDNQENNQQQPSPEALKKAVETINKNLQNSSAVFGFHEKTNRVTIKIVDKETKEVIREVPPEKMLDMVAKAWELAGILVDEKR